MDKLVRKEKYKENCKERLKNIVSKKMKTVMIGSLSAVEERFGFLWANESDEPMTDDQFFIYEIFQELRSEILDLGNGQIRNAEKEIDQYTVEWNGYQYHFKMKDSKDEY